MTSPDDARRVDALRGPSLKLKDLPFMLFNLALKRNKLPGLLRFILRFILLMIMVYFIDDK
jgi:hypothetical protein